MIDYKAVIKDLNKDIYESFGIEPSEDGFEYTYITNGAIHIIEFYGVEIFNSIDYYFETGKDVCFTMIEFEDYLEDTVKQLGQKFLRFSFNDFKYDIDRLKPEEVCEYQNEISRLMKNYAKEQSLDQK